MTARTSTLPKICLIFVPTNWSSGDFYSGERQKSVNSCLYYKRKTDTLADTFVLYADGNLYQICSNIELSILFYGIYGIVYV